MIIIRITVICYDDSTYNVATLPPPIPPPPPATTTTTTTTTTIMTPYTQLFLPHTHNYYDTIHTTILTTYTQLF